MKKTKKDINIFIGYSATFNYNGITSIRDVVTKMKEALNEFTIVEMNDMGVDSEGHKTSMFGNFLEACMEAVRKCDIYLPLVQSDFDKESYVNNEIVEVKKYKGLKEIIPVSFDNELPFELNSKSGVCFVDCDNDVEKLLDVLLSKVRAVADKLLNKGKSILSDLDIISHPGDVLGREELEEEIERKLSQSNIVILYGFPGMGKTALAKSYCCHRNQEGKSYILDASNGISDAIIKSRIYNFHEQQDLKMELDYKIKALGEYDDNAFIIFDNCDVEIGEEDIKVLKLLASHECKYIITTSINNSACLYSLDDRFKDNQIEVGELRTEYLLKIAYKEFGRELNSSEEEKLKKLFEEECFNNTLSICTLLNIISTSYDGVDDYLNTNASIFDCNETIYDNSNSINGRNITEKLRELYKTSKCSDEEKLVAFLLSHIDPYVGQTFQETADLLKNKIANRDPIKIIVKKCLIIPREERQILGLEKMYSAVIYDEMRKTEDFHKVCSEALTKLFDKLLADDVFNPEELLKDEKLISYILEHRRESAKEMGVEGKLFLRLLEIYKYFDMYSHIRRVLEKAAAEEKAKVSAWYNEIKDYLTAEEAFLYYSEKKYGESVDLYEKLSADFLEANPLVKMDYARSYDRKWKNRSKEERAADNETVYEKVLGCYTAVKESISVDDENQKLILLELNKRIQDLNREHGKEQNIDEIERIIDEYEKILGSGNDVRKINLIKAYTSAGLYYRNIARKMKNKGNHEIADDYARKAMDKFIMGINHIAKENQHYFAYEGYADCNRDLADCFNYYSADSIDTAMAYYTEALRVFVINHDITRDTSAIEDCIGKMIDSCNWHQMKDSEVKKEYLSSQFKNLKHEEKIDYDNVEVMLNSILNAKLENKSNKSDKN